MRRTLLTIVGLLALAVPASARAGHMVTVALEAGGAFHSVFSGLGSTVGGGIEGGVVLLHDRLDVSLSLAYDQPGWTLSASDPRLVATGGDFDWTLEQQILVLGLVGRYRFLTGKSGWDVYGCLGPKLYMLHTSVNGASGGQSFGENQQFDTEVGLLAGLGGELKVGPGSALVEVDLNAAGLQGLVTGKVAASALGAVVGYRLMF